MYRYSGELHADSAAVQDAAMAAKNRAYINAAGELAAPTDPSVLRSIAAGERAATLANQSDALRRCDGADLSRALGILADHAIDTAVWRALRVDSARAIGRLGAGEARDSAAELAQHLAHDALRIAIAEASYRLAYAAARADGRYIDRPVLDLDSATIAEPPSRY